MEAVVKYIKVRYNTLSLLSILVSPNFSQFIRESVRFVHFLTKYSFFKFQLFQIPASSGNFYFKLRQILASSNSGSHRRPLVSGCEKFWLLQFLKNSSFSRFQLQKIPASPNSGFLRRPILKQAAKNSGFEEFCLWLLCPHCRLHWHSWLKVV